MQYGGSASTNADNQLASDANDSYTYDKNGNLTTATRNGTGSTQYAWDYRNRLTDVTFKDGSGAVTGSIHYTYDDNNNRISQVVKDASGTVTLTEFYVYGGSNLLLVLDGSGNVKQRYFNGPNENQVLAEETNIVSSGAGDTHWALTDHEGSVRDVIDNSGSVLDHIKYDSFGNILSQSNSADAMRMAYTGQQYDSQTGLYYDHARYYDPATGRFLSTDPAGFTAGDENLYRYVGNSPVDNTDPTGKDACSSNSGEDFSGEQDSSYGSSGGDFDGSSEAAAQDANNALQAIHSGQYGADELRRLRDDLLQLGYPSDATNQYINELANAAVSRNSAAAQQIVDANSGITGFFNNVQRYYSGAGEALIDDANHSDSVATASVEGFLGQYLETFGSMLNIPAQREARIAASDIYQNTYGLNSAQAWFLSSAYYTPVLNSFVGGYEMGQGQSIGAFDVGRQLTAEDYTQRTLTIAQNIGFVAGLDGMFRPAGMSPSPATVSPPPTAEVPPPAAELPEVGVQTQSTPGSPKSEPISVNVFSLNSLWSRLDPVDITVKGNTYSGSDMQERLDSFTNGDMTPVVNDGVEMQNRFFGGNVKVSGRYVSPDSFANRSDAVNLLGLNPDWGGNQAQFVSTATLRPGTLTFRGTAAPQPITGGTLPGGARQTFIPANQLLNVNFGAPKALPTGP